MQPLEGHPLFVGGFFAAFRDSNLGRGFGAREHPRSHVMRIYGCFTRRSKAETRQSLGETIRMVSKCYCTGRGMWSMSPVTEVIRPQTSLGNERRAEASNRTGCISKLRHLRKHSKRNYGTSTRQDIITTSGNVRMKK